MDAAGTWKALAARFRAVAADARSAAELCDRLSPLLREAGQRLLADLEVGHLFARPGFAAKFRANLDRERAQKRGIPEHRRAQRGVTEALSLDPYCRWFTLYAARHLADDVDYPACGFGAFDNRGRDESQTRSMLIERAQAFAQACELIAKRMSTPLPVPRVTFDQSGAMIQSGPMPLSRLLREVVDRARGLLARIEACERTASGDYSLRDPHAGSIAGGVRVLWENMVLLACQCSGATIAPETPTPEQVAEFESCGVLARAAAPTRGHRPLADALKQLTFALALDDAGRFPDPIPAASVAKIRTIADELDGWRDTIMRAERDELDTLAADFADLAKRDATLTARLTEVGEPRRVWVLSNDCNAAALRTFRRLASEAARTLGVARPSRPDESADDWLAYLFVAGEGLGYVETEHSDMAESQRGDTTEAVPFRSAMIRNAAEASALVLRRVAAQYDAERPKAQTAPQTQAEESGDRAKREYGPDSVPLTTDHEDILAFLGKTPTKCKTVVTVAGDGPIRNRETVGRLLRELAEWGLVERPHGLRKGYALTDAGRKRLPVGRPT